MQPRSFALGHVPVWVVLPSGEQHPHTPLHTDEAVPALQLRSLPTDLQQHAVPREGG